MGRAPIGAHHIDVALALLRRIEGDPLTVGRPAGRADGRSTKQSELYGVQSVTQISSFPERKDAKATRFPSAEYCGALSARVDAINLAGEPPETFDLGPAVLQMLVSESICP